jgi:glycosyltransferase involved in cell wall biosynthesis
MSSQNSSTFSNRDLVETMSVTVVILTFNESLHIDRCVRSAQQVASDVLVVDSYSTDDTLIQVEKLGCRVLQHEWLNHANQVNWALENGNIRSDWVMRLDADEFLDEQLVSSIKTCLSQAESDIGGFEINRRIRFLGKDIRHGGMAPMWVTRLWRNGWAKCEVRWMDEHMILSRGRVGRLSGAIIDDNLNTLTWWTQKHNLYANREAVDLLEKKLGLGMSDDGDAGLNQQAWLKRWLKTRLYARLPLGVRPWLYFIYRTILRLGVLDGAKGMLFHTLQGLWYRLLVDAKVGEVQYAMEQEGYDFKESVHRVLGIELEYPEYKHTNKAKS